MHAKTMPRATHMADAGMQDRHPANNAYERFNGKDSVQDPGMRRFGFRAPALLGLLITCHNFMRPHRTWAAGHRQGQPGSQ